MNSWFLIDLVSTHLEICVGDSFLLIVVVWLFDWFGGDPVQDLSGFFWIWENAFQDLVSEIAVRDSTFCLSSVCMLGVIIHFFIIFFCSRDHHSLICFFGCYWLTEFPFPPLFSPSLLGFQLVALIGVFCFWSKLNSEIVFSFLNSIFPCTQKRGIWITYWSFQRNNSF